MYVQKQASSDTANMAKCVSNRISFELVQQAKSCFVESVGREQGVGAAAAVA